MNCKQGDLAYLFKRDSCHGKAGIELGTIHSCDLLLHPGTIVTVLGQLFLVSEFVWVDESHRYAIADVLLRPIAGPGRDIDISEELPDLVTQ